MSEKKFKFLSLLFLILGAFLLFDFKLNLTGAVVGVSDFSSFFLPIFGFVLILISVVLFVGGENLEEILEDNEINELNCETTSVNGKGRGSYMKERNLKAREINQKITGLSMPASMSSDYRRLVHRLGDMEKGEETATDNQIIGAYLSPSELDFLKNQITKYVPSDYLKKDFKIVVGGSLSSKREGKRHPKFGMKEGLKSDEFYRSDVDIGIYSPDLFDNINATWFDAIKCSNGGSGGGRNANNETYRIVHPKWFTKKELKNNYMKNAPEWVKDLTGNLSKVKFAGEYRPVNIKIYRNNFNSKLPVDIVYEK